MRKFLLALMILAAPLAMAQDRGSYYSYSGTGANDNDVLITTGSGRASAENWQYCVLMSTAGAVDVFVSLDGTNYATAALSLQDMGATSTTPVLVTSANRVYGFVVKARAIRVLQNGATAASATMNCW